MTNCYDDAELISIKLARIALFGPSNKLSLLALRDLRYLQERYGDDGPLGLVVAMANQLSSALYVVADMKGISIDQLLDSFEMGKLDQIVNGVDDE